MAADDTIALTTHEAFSGIFGSISLAAWIFLLVPQLYENYTQGRADGISLAFLTIWFIGDVTNLIGAIWAELVPTVIALAVYFCFADSVLILQCLYYNLWVNRERGPSAMETAPDAPTANGQPNATYITRPHAESFDENEPLLSRQTSHPPTPHRRTTSQSSLGLPGSHMGHNRRRSTSGTLAKVVEVTSVPDKKPTTALRAILTNTLSIFGICVVGTMGWALAWRIGAWKPAPAPGTSAPPSTAGATPTPLGATILGYTSAILYLTARLPQIYKNARTRSCDGLSLLFFLLSLLGNITYGAGILAHSLEGGYVKTNAPWLLGSLGTVVEDFVVAGQFKVYGDGKGKEVKGEEECDVAVT